MQMTAAIDIALVSALMLLYRWFLPLPPRFTELYTILKLMNQWFARLSVLCSFIDVNHTGSQIPLFDVEPHDGSKRSQKFIMGKRNWCGVRWDGQTGDLVFTLFIEKEKGGGQTKGYARISLKKAPLLISQ